jgi:hypothetical protein
MSHVSTSDISKNLHHSKLIFIGAHQSYEYAGVGKGVSFDVEGEQHAAPVNFANASLVIDQGQKFAGSIKLGDAADVRLNGMHATSYLFDQARGDLKLFEGHKLIDDLKLDTGGRSIGVSSVSDLAGPGFVHITTGRFTFGEAITSAIPIHT